MIFHLGRIIMALDYDVQFVTENGLCLVMRRMVIFNFLIIHVANATYQQCNINMMYLYACC